MSKILEYAKGVVAAGGVLVNVVIVATADQAISFDEARGIWLAIVGLATVAGVIATKNRSAS